jgi:hypothetical protein
MMKSAKFHDIAAKVFPGYEEYGYIPYKFYSKKENMIKDYINTHSTEFAPGDIIHVGGTSDEHPHSFVLIGDETKLLKVGVKDKLLGEEEYAISLPIRYKDYIPTGISYKEMLDKISKDMKEINDYFSYEFTIAVEFFGLYCGDIPDEEFSEIYKWYETKGIL